MKNQESDRPTKMLVTVRQYRLLQTLAARAGLLVMEFVRTQMSEQIDEVVVSDTVRVITRVIAPRQPVGPTDIQRRCPFCHQAVYLHDAPPPGIPVVCVPCAGLKE